MILRASEAVNPTGVIQGRDPEVLILVVEDSSPMVEPPGLGPTVTSTGMRMNLLTPTVTRILSTMARRNIRKVCSFLLNLLAKLEPIFLIAFSSIAG